MPGPLAAKIRAKYPGAYDDLDDATLEAQVVAKYPEYRDLAEQRPPDFTATNARDEQGNPIVNFGKEALASFNPVTINRAIQSAFWHPIETGKGILAAQDQVRQQAMESFERGDYLTGTAKMIDWLIPLLGPRLSQAGDYLAEGETAKGLGAATDVGLQIAGPGIVKQIPRVRIPSPLRNRNALDTAAMEFGQREGIPIDAATATQNRFVQGVQRLADESLGGSMIAAGKQRAQVEGLTATGQRLAERAMPGPVTAEQAGQGVRGAVTQHIGGLHDQANRAYEALRRIEANPANADVITPPSVPKPTPPRGPTQTVGRFTPADMTPTAEELFKEVLRDARQHGYKGTSAELRRQFDEAQALVGELQVINKEYGPRALLEEIKKYGGIGDDPTYPGEIAQLRENARTAKSRGSVSKKTLRTGKGREWQTGNLGGVPGVLTKDGMTLDRMAENLRQDPRFAHITGPNELLDEIDAAWRGAGESGGNLETSLRSAGIRPGAQWWALEAEAEPLQGMRIPMAVDLRASKVQLRPLYEQMRRQMPVTQQNASKGYKALENVVNGPDYAPFSQVDADLSAIKGITRGALLPTLRNVSQGLAAKAVQTMEEAVQSRIARAGPDAVAALQAGRMATRAKYATRDVLKGIRTEPVRTVRALTAPGDSAIAQLKNVATVAPQEMPKLARAYLNNLLDLATAEGGFDRAARLAAEWQKLGPQTKKVLFQDPAYIQDLDRFFLLAKRIAVNPTAGSPTALTLIKYGEAAALLTNPLVGVPATLGATALAALLRSRTGVKLLSRGLTVPLGNKAAAAAVAGEITAALDPRPVLAPAAQQSSESPRP